MEQKFTPGLKPSDRQANLFHRMKVMKTLLPEGKQGISADTGLVP
jgi:hypothetical protein